MTRAERNKARRTLHERDGDRCWICGRVMLFGSQFRRHRDWATIDHVRAVSRGGSNDLDNLKLAHSRCNVERLDGLDPSGIPIWPKFRHCYFGFRCRIVARRKGSIAEIHLIDGAISFVPMADLISWRKHVGTE